MLNTMLKYGLLAGILMSLLGYVPYAIWGDRMGYTVGEVVGYTSMILSLLSIFIGVKNYRDQQLGGKINFWQGFQVGMAITIVAAFIFAVYCYIFFAWIEPDFVQKYYQYFVDQIKNSGQVKEKIDEELKNLKATMSSRWANSMFFQSFIMFVTVALLGAAISVVAALIHRKK